MLATTFEKNNAKCIKTPGDGNCLFHSISQADSKIYKPTQLRKFYAHAIRVYPNVFRAFCRQNNTWTLTNKQASRIASSNKFLPSSDCVAFLSHFLCISIIVVACTNDDLKAFNEVFIYEPISDNFSYIVIFLNLQVSHYELISSNDQTVFERSHLFIKALYQCANNTVLKVPERLFEKRNENFYLDDQ
jgi:hypothetical protein